MTWKLKNAVYGLFMIGIMIPAQAALLPLFQILDTLGLKGGYLGLMIPYIAGALPMSIMILVGFYRGIPREMEEAAYIVQICPGILNTDINNDVSFVCLHAFLQKYSQSSDFSLRYLQ